MSNVSKEKKHRDPYRFQKRVMSVVAIVLCLSLVLSLERELGKRRPKAAASFRFPILA